MSLFSNPLPTTTLAVSQIYVEILRLFACLVHTLDVDYPVEVDHGEVHEPKYLCNHILLNDSLLHRVVNLLDAGAHASAMSPVAMMLEQNGSMGGKFPGPSSGDDEAEAYKVLVEDLGVTLTRKVCHIFF